MNRDWGNRAPVLRFIPEQDRLNLIGLSPAEVGQQLQFLLTGVAVTQVREDIRNVPMGLQLDGLMSRFPVEWREQRATFLG
jgi:multidrug efflux pump subunit AcrB